MDPEYIFKRRRNKEGRKEKDERKERRGREVFQKSVRTRQPKGKWAYKLEQAFQKVDIHIINEDKNVLKNKQKHVFNAS